MSCAEEMRGKRVGLENQERVVLCKVYKLVVQQEVIRKANGAALSAPSCNIQRFHTKRNTTTKDTTYTGFSILFLNYHWSSRSASSGISKDTRKSTGGGPL